MNRNGISIRAKEFFLHLPSPLYLGPAGAFAGWLAFDDTWLIHRSPASVAQGFLAAVFVLSLLWRRVRQPLDGYAVMAGWYLGACAVIPGIWHGFFGARAGGFAIWIGLSALLAAAYLLPARWSRFGLLTGAVLTLVPPLGLFGLASPLLAAGAMFPGAGLWGIVLLLLFFFLSSLRHRFADVAAVLMMLWGIAHAGLPLPAPPAVAWGMQSYEGEGSPNATIEQQFARQDRFKAIVRQAILQGAKLIVVPEGTDPLWDDGQAFYWKDIADLAKARHTQVLLGVYTRGFPPSQSQDGLVDLTTGKLYPAGIPMPIGMWVPWDRNPQHVNFPLKWHQVQILPTRYGTAIYSICYENLLLWPTILASSHHPALLISAANQWFARGDLSVPQMRSLRMQAALFGLPLISAINWPNP